MLTDRAVDALEKVGVIARAAMLAFVVWVLSRRLGILDASAVLVGAWFAVRYMRPEAGPTSTTINVTVDPRVATPSEARSRATALARALAECRGP